MYRISEWLEFDDSNSRFHHCHKLDKCVSQPLIIALLVVNVARKPDPILAGHDSEAALNVVQNSQLLGPFVRTGQTEHR